MLGRICTVLKAVLNRSWLSSVSFQNNKWTRFWNKMESALFKNISLSHLICVFNYQHDSTSPWSTKIDYDHFISVMIDVLWNLAKWKLEAAATACWKEFFDLHKNAARILLVQIRMLETQINSTWFSFWCGLAMGPEHNRVPTQEPLF